jgi:hypothetical protein
MIAGQLLIGASFLGLGVSSVVCTNIDQIKKIVSPNTTVRSGANNQRWSDFAAPVPGAVFTVGVESDVAKIVTAAVKTNTPFLVQSGANGWADTFKLNRSGVIIDVSQLKGISFNNDKTQVTFQAGVTNADMINAAWNNNARVSVSTCNCVSLLGATLGGGLSRTQGVYGLNVDQIISLNVVDANGNKQTVTPQSNPDLWWALRGAGANFGIVTSGTFKSTPIPQANNTAWTGPVIFDSSKIEQVIGAIDKLALEPEMQMDVYFTVSPLDNKPAVLTLPFYLGTAEQGRAKFASILSLAPTADLTQVIPYNTWNAAGDAFCTPGGRKPSYSTALKSMNPTTWRQVWNEYKAFYDQYPEANQTTVLTECYSNAKTAKSVVNDGTSSYPFRDIKCYSIAIPWYTSPSLDNAAIAFGQKVRSLWAASAGTNAPSSYVFGNPQNFQCLHRFSPEFYY